MAAKFSRRRRKSLQHYTPEFKAAAVQLARVWGISQSEVAARLSVHPSTLHGWLTQAAAAPGAEDREELVQQLRHQQRQLDWLMRAARDDALALDAVKKTSGILQLPVTTRAAIAVAWEHVYSLDVLEEALEVSQQRIAEARRQSDELTACGDTVSPRA